MVADCPSATDGDGSVKGLSLCSGVGGLDIAMQSIGVETVAYSEIDPYPQAILHARMRDGWLDSAPIWPNIKTLSGADVLARCGDIDIVYGGIPCQPHSTAGSRRGTDDERDLWPDTLRLLWEIRPSLFLLENVAGFALQRDGEPAFAWNVVTDLTESGYDVRWTHVLAADAGAPHRRRRFFLLAVADPASGGYAEQKRERQTVGRGEQSDGLRRDEVADPGRHGVERRGTSGKRGGTAGAGQEEGIQRKRLWSETDNGSSEVADTGREQQHVQQRVQRVQELAGSLERVGDTDNTGLERRNTERSSPNERFPFPPSPKGDWRGIPEQLWPALESGVHGMANGLVAGVDRHRRRRLEALGNGVVPHAAVLALAELLGVD